jgi:nanoRNase/pAp phosphatase (c-di-AMP/oligoRNAs hydrolase)
MERESAVQDRLSELQAALKDVPRILILPHNDPDPDAIAASVALRYLVSNQWGVEAQIVYDGIVGRAENMALVHRLGRPLKQLQPSHLREGSPFALIDTQPGAGNNALPPDAPIALVFDHHPPRESRIQVPFVDIRPNLGAISTAMTHYLQAAGLEPSPALATALFYGIKTDTMGLGRGAVQEDVDAYFYLQPLLDVEMLAEVENAQLPVEYFERLAATLQAARVYDNLVIATIIPMTRPDLAAEMADLLLRLEGIQWVVCMGAFQDQLNLAVRTRRRYGAQLLAQAIVGSRGSAGGHGSMAGGQIALGGRDPVRLVQSLARRARQYLEIPKGTRGQPLVKPAGTTRSR